jgi:purine-binding chemotaxis protein CheW
MQGVQRHVVFVLEGQHYALPLAGVERVVRAAHVTPLPQAPPVVLGIVNVQGRVTPVINLRRRFSLPARDLALGDQFVIARTPRRTLALVVDDVVGVVAHPPGEVSAPQEILPVLPHLAGVITRGDGMVLIYDLEACLSLDEERQLDLALRQP